MAIKFEKIKAGMELWSRGRQAVGNTKMKRMAEWRVDVREVYRDSRSALVSWNGNAPEVWTEGRLTRLYTKRMAKKVAP